MQTEMINQSIHYSILVILCVTLAVVGFIQVEDILFSDYAQKDRFEKSVSG